MKKSCLILLFLIITSFNVTAQIPILEFNFTRTRSGIFTEFPRLTFPAETDFSRIEDGATIIDIKKLVILPEENFTYSSNEPTGLIISIDQENALVKITPERRWFGNVPVTIFISSITPYTTEKIKQFERKQKLLDEINLENLNKVVFDDLLLDIFSNKVNALIEEREQVSYQVDISSQLKEDSLEVRVGDDLEITTGFYPGNIRKKPKISVKIDTALVKEPIVDHCSDNIQNYDETGVDCGGSCLPCRAGISISLIIILIFWISLLVVIYFNIDRLKKFFKTYKKKKEPKKVKKPEVDYVLIFSNLQKKVTNKNTAKIFEKFSDLFRDFFGQQLNIKYEFTYDELKKEIKKNKIKRPLQEKLLNLAAIMSEIDYSGYKIKRKELNKLIKDAIIIAKNFKPKIDISSQKKNKHKKKTI